MEELIGIHGFKIRNIEDLQNYIQYLNETITPAQQVCGKRIESFKIIDRVIPSNFKPNNKVTFSNDAYIISGKVYSENHSNTYTVGLKFAVAKSEFDILIPEI